MITGKLPTTTVSHARMQICEPTNKPKHDVRDISGAWGTARIEGRIGLSHVRLIEAMCFHAINVRELSDGRLQLLVDPYTICKCHGNGKPTSSSTYNRMIREIMKVLIDLKINPCKTFPAGRHVMCHIISEIELSTVAVKNPLSRVPDTAKRKHADLRYLSIVTLSEPYAKMLKDDLKLYYDPLIFKDLESGISQAIARLLLGHSKNRQPPEGWTIDLLIEAVGGGGSGIRNRRREIRNDIQALEEIGIFVTDDKMGRI